MSAGLTSSRQPLPPPDANLGYLFRLSYQRFRTLMENELEGTGLSAQEYAILSVFESRVELSTSELARISQVTRQTMHTAIRRLESARLLERRKENQRVVLLRPTEHGRDVFGVATKQVRAVERAAFAGHTENDEATVRAWLAGLASMTMASRGADADRKETS